MPSPLNKTTLVIVLGASTWPHASQAFPGSKAFTSAATDFKQYLIDTRFFGLTPENLLDLFDEELAPVQILRRITSWIKERLSSLNSEEKTASTLLFYFVGHADFARSGSLYCLAVQCSSRDDLDISGIPVETLLRTFTRTASQLSQILIFDCCYAASAYQRQGSGSARSSIEEAIENTARMTGKGTYFLCSSGKNIESRISSDKSYPLFSQALLQVLRQGDIQQPNRPYLAIREIAELTEQKLREMPGSDIPIPEYSPTNKQKGDIARLPLFPNPIAGTLFVPAQSPPTILPKKRRHLGVREIAIIVPLIILFIISGILGSVKLFSPHTSLPHLSAYDDAVATQGIQFGVDAAHTHSNSHEQILTPANVSHLKKLWSFLTGGSIFSSPAVANGVVYVGSEDGNLYAFPATCSAPCGPLWSSRINTTGDHHVDSSPAVANGVVYIGSDNGSLYTFRATSTCDTPCRPLLVYPPVGSQIWASPTVADKIVYVGAWNGALYAFDTRCSPQCPGKVLFTATNNSQVVGVHLNSPAVDVNNGTIYVTSNTGILYAFDVNCSTPCQPLWSSIFLGKSPSEASLSASPAIADGKVYIGSDDGHFYAFPETCSTPCQPLWSSISSRTNLNFGSSPAIANNIVYIGSDDGQFYAFPETCSTPCQPLWAAQTKGGIDSSPTVANGVVYVGSEDGHLYAFVANHICNTPCQPLWSSKETTGSIQSSPAVANGMVYVGSDDGLLYAFGLSTSS
jgi:outer membrane protein assembly factor BamB